jgi:NADH:ubiquinone oxidoreductase subunit 6 (subunit J)
MFRKNLLLLPVVLLLLTIFPIQVDAGNAINPNNNTNSPTQNTFRIGQPAAGYGVNISGSAEHIVDVILKNVITLFFTVGAIGVIIYFIWGAVDWILAGGDKEKISSARKKITNALIGLTLLALAFVIIAVVGEIVGFSPLKNLQIRGLGNEADFVPNQ